MSTPMNLRIYFTKRSIRLEYKRTALSVLYVSVAAKPLSEVAFFVTDLLLIVS